MKGGRGSNSKIDEKPTRLDEMLKIAINRIKWIRSVIHSKGKIKISALSTTHLLPKLYVESDGEIVIGRFLMSEKNTVIESYSKGKIHIGNNVFLNSNVKIVARNRISIGNNTVIAPNVCIYDHDHNWRGKNMQGAFIADDIIIGDNVWIGANSVILRGTVIGDGAVIAAGSVVKGTIDENVLFYQEKTNRIKGIKDEL